MFSKPLAFGLLALGCLTAAAGGAYVAARHNADDAMVAIAPQPSSAPATSTAPGTAASTAQPVTETEATVAPADPAPAARPEADPPATQPAPAVGVTSRTTRAPTVPARHDERPPQPHPAPVTAEPAARANDVPASAPPVPAPVPQPAPPVEQPRNPDPQPEPPRVPQFEEVVVPASSVIGLQMQTSLSSERARVEDRVEARVTRDVHAGDRVAIPAGSRVLGSVTLVDRGGKMKERARLGIRFHTLVLADGSEVPLHTEAIIREGESPAGDSAKKIGGAAVGGAILGAILGGGKGAAIGGMAGAGGGTAAVMAGDRNAATLSSGAIVTARLASPVTIQLEKREEQR